MAIKVANTEVIGDDRNITFTSNQCIRDANTQVSGTAQLTGSGYSIGDNKVITASGKQFNCAVFDNSTCLVAKNPLVPIQGTVAAFMGGGSPDIALSNIERFPFASVTDISDVGELARGVHQTSGGGNMSTTHGYVSGSSPLVPIQPTASDCIQKFAFSTSTSASCIGTLSICKFQTGPANSDTNGYQMAGFQPGTTGIDKFPFASDTNASLTPFSFTFGTRGLAGTSSNEDGYAMGGFFESPGPGTIGDTIQKFPFASEDTLNDVGELSSPSYVGSGAASETHGYAAIFCTSCEFNKFPFANDTLITVSQTFTDPAPGAAHPAVRGGQNSSDTGAFFTASRCSINVPFASDTEVTLTAISPSVCAGCEPGRASASD